MDEKKLFKELENLKKLLMLSSLKSGASANEIRNTLKINGKVFKKLLPIKKLKKKGN